MSIPRLVLGSGSPYRKQLLDNLGISFTQMVPDADETPARGEDPHALSLRLGCLKAQSVADMLRDEQGWIAIGSDQVCHHKGLIHGKPGTPARAALQLAAFSGQWVTFSTSLALISSDGRSFSGVESYECCFRELSAKDIDTYLQIDQPFDCAGSIKVEKAGVALLCDTRGRDVNTLYGLPLMLLSEALGSMSYSIFDFKN